jgi:hypothetical protein
MMKTILPSFGLDSYLSIFSKVFIDLFYFYHIAT